MSQEVPPARCSRCLLPSSLPGSKFNAEEECSWCQSGYPSYVPQGEGRLREVLARGRNPRAPADCLVGVSGGKDSSYVLLQLKQEYGMRVEAFTYVHEATRDFAVENARRICEALGVRQHVVSLKGNRHVDAFLAFFRVWLDSRDPIAAGSACIGCKHLHLLGTRLASRRKIPMVVWSDCPLENPPFAQYEVQERTRSARLRVRELAARVWRELFLDRGYRQAFLKHAMTCIYGGLALRPEGLYLRLRYPRVRHIHFYDYLRWDGEEILQALQPYAWAVPDSLPNDWHSDCELNILREYMYQQMLGATEVDAHLSNQIRHGIMTRERAWRELVRIRAHQREDLRPAARRLGLGELESKLDPRCFEVSDERGRAQRGPREKARREAAQPGGAG